MSLAHATLSAAVNDQCTLCAIVGGRAHNMTCDTLDSSDYCYTSDSQVAAVEVGCEVAAAALFAVCKPVSGLQYSVIAWHQVCLFVWQVIDIMIVYLVRFINKTLMDNSFASGALLHSRERDKWLTLNAKLFFIACLNGKVIYQRDKSVVMGFFQDSLNGLDLFLFCSRWFWLGWFSFDRRTFFM